MTNEKRLIDLDVAIEKIKDEGVLGEGYSAYERIEDVCDMLEDCPTVDAVEVVRCEDCVHYRKKGGAHLDDYCAILYYGDGTHRTACERDFCSYGKKRGV